MGRSTLMAWLSGGQVSKPFGRETPDGRSRPCYFADCKSKTSAVIRDPAATLTVDP